MWYQHAAVSLSQELTKVKEEEFSLTTLASNEMKLIARTVWLTDLLCWSYTYCTLLLTDFLSCREWMSHHTHKISIRALTLPYFSCLLLLEQFCTLREICAAWYHANQGLCRMLINVTSLQCYGGFVDDLEASMTSLCSIRVLTMSESALLAG